jgi:hypothetical protein
MITDEQRDEAYKKMRFNPYSLENMNDELKDDKQLALRILQITGVPFEFLSERLRSDKELATLAIKKEQFMGYFLGQQLLNDKDFILTVICGPLYGRLSEKLQEDEEICLKAVESTKGAILRSEVPLSVRGNKEIIMSGVFYDGKIIEFASNELKDDEEVALMAIESNYQAFTMISERLQNTESIIFKMVDNYFESTVGLISEDYIKDIKNVMNLLEYIDRNNMYEDVKERVLDDFLRKILINSTVMKIYKDSIENKENDSPKVKLQNVYIYLKEFELDNLLDVIIANKKGLKF